MNYNILLDFNSVSDKVNLEFEQTEEIFRAKLIFVTIYNKINLLI